MRDNRVVEIFSGNSRGSGYQIAPRLVLTAYHVLAPASEWRVEVQFLRDYGNSDDKMPPVHSADILWPKNDPGDDLDVALLLLDEPAGPDNSPVTWTALETSGQCKVEAIGFPRTELVEGTLDQYDTRNVNGEISQGDRLKARQDRKGTIDFQVTSKPEATKSDWEGTSGAAVFLGRDLVGIITKAESGKVLKMLPIDRLFKDDAVKAAVQELGIRLPRRACPDGVEWISDDRTPGSGLHAYLRNRLPYYSRDEHLKQHPPPAANDILSEQALLDGLEKGNAPGIIVTGIGGVGKTRLCLELGRLADKQGWEVFRVKPGVGPLSPDDLRRLGGHADGPHPVLLVFDYLERQKGFQQVLTELVGLNAEKDRLRFVANCRRSFYDQSDYVEIRPQRLELSVPSLPGERDWQQGYRQGVIGHILKAACLPDNARTRHVCRGRPAFAALLAYVKENDPESEDDIDALLADDDIESWLVNRVMSSFGGKDVSNNDLTTFMTFLPIFKERVFRFNKIDPPLFLIYGALEHDGWVEPSPLFPDMLEIALDVFADSIILKQMKKWDTGGDVFVAAIFERARNAECLTSSYRSFQGLAEEDPVSRVDWLAVFRSEIKTAPEAWRPLLGEVLHGPLLDNEQKKVRLLADIEGQYPGWLDDPGVRLAVGRLARWLARSPALDRPTKERIEAWIIAVLKEDPDNNYLLTSALRLVPDRFKSNALEYINKYPDLFVTHYLLSSWLKLDLPIESVQSAIREWLDRFSGIGNASFVIAPWLDAGGSTDFVRADMLRWLDSHARDLDASYVYYSWLRRGGSLGTVEVGIRKWLALHRDTREAGSVYAGLLYGGVAPGEIQEGLEAWLASYKKSPGASFVYCAWLGRRGGAETIWDSVREWLDEHRTDLEASHVYRAWLAGGGEVDAVRQDIHDWLDRHGSALAADHVYAAWLKAKGGIEAVRTQLRAWLDRHNDKVEAGQVIDAWLGKTEDFAYVRDPSLKWLSTFYLCEEAVYGLTHLAEQPDLPNEAVLQILDWCCRYAKHTESILRMSRLGNFFSDTEIFPHAIQAAIQIAEVIPENIDENKADFFTGIVGWLSESVTNFPECQNDFERLILIWLNHPCSFNPQAPIFLANQHIELVFVVRKLIENGEISFDAAVIGRFYAWVRQWKEFKVSQARDAAGDVESETWDRLEADFRARRRICGVVLCSVNEGFVVDLDGALAFLPASQVDIRPVPDITPLLGSPQRFRLLKLDRSSGNIVVSRRAVLDEESRAEQRSELVASLKEGQILNGVVKNITDYGAFVDLGSADGLLHVTDIAGRRTNHPSEALHIGQNVKVQVIRFNPETQRIWLGMKQLEADPWEGVELKYPAGARFRGRVTNIADYGAFVELEPGVEGLVHVSEMSWTKKNVNPRKMVSKSQEVEVMVLDVDPQKRRISLGLKQTLANPWEAFLEEHPVGSESDGEIGNITEFGLFIGLPGDIDGLVHMSDIDWNRPGEVAINDYRKGDAMRVKVLEIDVEKERISLGIKQLQPDPFEAAIIKIKKGDVVTGTIATINNDGIEVILADGVAGFIRRSELSRDRGEQRANRFAVGEKVDAKVTAIDRATRKMILSIKARETDHEKRAMAAVGSPNSGASPDERSRAP